MAPMSSAVLPVDDRSVLDRVAQRPWWLFAGWLAAIGTVHALIWAGHGWVWFPQGAHLLFSPGWSHLYSQHSDLQIGPLAFLIAAPLSYGLPATVAEVIAVLLMSAAGLVILAQLRSLIPARTAQADRTFLLAGLAFLVLWAELAVTYGHADDVLALLFTTFAVRALRSDRPYLGAILLALAADCKPWAVMFVPLLLLADRRSLVRAVPLWAFTVALAWLPFYLADPRTLSVASFKIPNELATSLRVLGVHTAMTPSWDRTAQIALAVVLGLILMRRGRWSAVIVVAVAARILLDPSTKSYYDAGLLLGAVLCDLVLLAGPIPMLSVTAVLVLYLPMFGLHSQPHIFGLIRTTYLLTVMVALTALPDEFLRQRPPQTSVDTASS
ncbi:hypothetical protein BH10ACT8_BH10ACT8_11510 [soil metagenome]